MDVTWEDGGREEERKGGRDGGRLSLLGKAFLFKRQYFVKAQVLRGMTKTFRVVLTY